MTILPGKLGGACAPGLCPTETGCPIDDALGVVHSHDPVDDARQISTMFRALARDRAELAEADSRLSDAAPYVSATRAALDRLTAPVYAGGAVTPPAPIHEPRLTSLCEFSLDWFAFTVRQEKIALAPEVESILEPLFLPGSAWVSRRGGAHGYTHSETRAGVLRAWSPQSPGMGIHYSFSGRAVRDLQTDDVPALVFRLRRLGLHVSRLDLAFDDFTGLIDLPRIFDMISGTCDDFRLRSRFSAQPTRDGRPGSIGRVIRQFGQDPQTLVTRWTDDCTIYLGRATGAAQVRIYNKKAEQGLSDEDCPHWVRVELQLREDRPDLFLDTFLEGTEQSPEAFRTHALSVLRSYVCFVVPSETDRNKGRWPLTDWWDSFTASASPISLGRRREKSTIERQAAWLAHSAAPSIYRTSEALGPQFLRSLLVLGQQRTDDAEFAAALASLPDCYYDPETGRFRWAEIFRRIIPDTTIADERTTA